jgi:hypothetical protein
MAKRTEDSSIHPSLAVETKKWYRSVPSSFSSRDSRHVVLGIHAVAPTIILLVVVVAAAASALLGPWLLLMPSSV